MVRRGDLLVLERKRKTRMESSDRSRRNSDPSRGVRLISSRRPGPPDSALVMSRLLRSCRARLDTSEKPLRCGGLGCAVQEASCSRPLVFGTDCPAAAGSTVWRWPMGNDSLMSACAAIVCRGWPVSWHSGLGT